MLARLMFMPVHVHSLGRHLLVHMIMMTIVVPVEVLVRDDIVPVDVGMPLP